MELRKSGTSRLTTTQVRDIKVSQKTTKCPQKGRNQSHLIYSKSVKSTPRTFTTWTRMYTLVCLDLHS